MRWTQSPIPKMFGLRRKLPCKLRQLRLRFLPPYAIITETLNLQQHVSTYTTQFPRTFERFTNCMKKQSEETSRGEENSGRTMSWTKKHARKGEDYKTSPREPLYGTVHESLIYPSGWVIPNCEVFLFKREPKRAARCQAEIFIPQSHKSPEQDAYKTRIKRYTPILFFPRDSNDMKHFLFEGEKSASRSFLPLTFSSPARRLRVTVISSLNVYCVQHN